eukprot:TRINITY_DN92886_c0_g1_i1.p1 TRINITY_DN92886_c0_g1~~TRINITY_DN92886_c0_g1_i1.p1  ORF type:complete len:408 (+),score=42.64 TRINITY_DN92886_c0_g1_i1:184-1224(+)
MAQVEMTMLCAVAACGATTSRAFTRRRHRARRSLHLVMQAIDSGSSGLGVRNEDRDQCKAQHLLEFERHGFLKRPGFLSAAEADVLQRLLWEVQGSADCEFAALKHQVRVQCGAKTAAACRDAADCRSQLRDFEKRGEVSFLQYFNLHRRSRRLRDVAMSPRLAFWASQLLGVPRLRLYQDALFVKRPGDGPTSWHSDLGLAPFDTNSFVTIWITLTQVPRKGGSSLCFASGSHRDFSLAYHGNAGEEDLSGRYDVKCAGALEPGDATIHHGWTLHCAAGVGRDAPARIAWAVCFVADGARLLMKKQRSRGGSEPEDAASFEPWIRDVKPGSVVNHAMVPLVPEIC